MIERDRDEDCIRPCDRIGTVEYLINKYQGKIDEINEHIVGDLSFTAATRVRLKIYREMLEDLESLKPPED